jgi:hypothetical protein
MLTVSHRLTIGEAAYTSAAHSRLVGLRTQVALDVPVNTAGIALAPAAGLSMAPEDPVVIELGYGDELETVFTGTVETVDWDIERVIVHAAGGFQKLLGANFNLFYEKSKAGDMISDVASQLDMATGTVESGLEFPAYALSASHTAYDSLRQLAQRCGFDLYADVDDQLVFAPYDPAETHVFQYGVNILSLRLDHPTESIMGAEIFGESPASHGQGQESTSWLTKKDVKGTAGDTSKGVWRRFDPAVRTQEDAGQIAEAVLAALRTRRACTLKVLGAPAVQLGHEIEISEMPLDDQNGTFKVTGVEHRLDIKKGFYTIIDGLEL